MILKNDIVILCGGRGTRVSHIYPNLPKVLFPISEGIPLLDALLSSLFLQGFKRFILCIGHLGEKIEEYCEDYPLKNLIIFSYEPEILMGTAGALRLAKGYIKSDPFLFLMVILIANLI